MSNYTTEVRWICETAYNNAHPNQPGTIADYLSAGRASIFNFQYPIFDEAYRSVLETKILKHYYTREIGEETVGLWKLRLDARLNEIMPFYNKLYSSELLEFNPLYDVNLTRTYVKEGSASKRETDNGSVEATDSMTGTVGDSGTARGTTATTRTLDTTTSTDITLDHTGAVTDAETGSASKDNTGTITDAGTSSNTKARTGTERTQGETVVDGTVITANSGTDTESTERDNKNDHWDYYSDTPQGTIGYIPGSEGTPQADANVRNQTYLSNVRHITDDTDGSSEDRTMVHGHHIQADDDTTTEVDSTLTLNTTESDHGTSGNTRTLNTSEDSESSKRNVRTFGNTDTTDQTVSDTGTISDSGTTSDTTANTRTYNTANTKESETTNTATGAYTNLDEYTETVQGKHGGLSYAKMLMEFRETFLNIDAMIIENLSDLFFGLWG